MADIDRLHGSLGQVRMDFKQPEKLHPASEQFDRLVGAALIGQRRAQIGQQNLEP